MYMDKPQALLKKIGIVLVGLFLISMFIPHRGDLPGEKFNKVISLENKQLSTEPFSDLPLEGRMVYHKIEPGDSFFSLVDNNHYQLPAGFSKKLVKKNHKKLRKILSQLKVGDKLYFIVNGDNVIDSISLDQGFNEVVIKTADLSYTNKQSQKYQQYHFANIKIKSSFTQDLTRAHIPQQVIWKIIDIFSWDIDWQRQVSSGMEVNLTYVEESIDSQGKTQAYPLKVELIFSKKKKFQAFYVQGAKEHYVDENGKFLKKGFIRNPLKFDRISSKFDLNRKHPILHTIRAHKGVDYAAKIGTPVKATGDGHVIFAGKKNGYGNVIELKHGKVYTTLYAHLHKIDKKIKKGARVKQGQKIGTVGMSGLATGPHLHYEFRINGKHKDPLTVKIPSSGKLSSKEKTELRQVMTKYSYLEKTAQLA